MFFKQVVLDSTNLIYFLNLRERAYYKHIHPHTIDYENRKSMKINTKQRTTYNIKSKSFDMDKPDGEYEGFRKVYFSLQPIH